MEPVLAGDKGSPPGGNHPDAGFWNQQLGPPVPSRPALAQSVDADVCIVGAGYTGLWTAWALLGAAPGLRVVLVEAQHAGFGASGRNGGWLSGLLPGNRVRLSAGPGGRSGVVALQRALIEAVGSVGSITAVEGIDCDFHHAGTLSVARNQAQLARLRAGVEEDRRWGLEEADLRVLTASETQDRVRWAGAVGSAYSPHCARIHPAKLARGLAAAVERRGATIYEHSPAVAWSRGTVRCAGGTVRCAGGTVRCAGGTVRCAGGTVRAPWVVLATEGYGASLPGRRRNLLPMNSSMVVTAPLPDEAWDGIGWSGAETLSDAAHAYVYMQRTADGRVALGGRGVPYRYGSRSARAAVEGAPAVTDAATVASLEAALRRAFPHVPGDVLAVERGWSGVLGVARDWCPSIVVERTGSASGWATAGGYVGDGVTTSHLAGLTLADLILGRDTDLTRLPWVGHRSRRWEPEPLRWLGVQAVYGLYRAADRSEDRRPGRAATSGWARLADRLAGR